MQSITWQELLDYIVESDVDLNSEVVLYDGSTGDEIECTLVEMQEVRSHEQKSCPMLMFNMEDEDGYYKMLPR